MLTLQFINENPEHVIERLAVKNFDAREPIMRVVELDKQRRAAQKMRDDNASQLNKMAAQIGALMKQGKRDEAEQAKEQVAALKAANKEIDDRMTAAASEITEILLSVPNVPYEGVPAGRSAEAGFPVYVGKGAKLQRALIQFFLDEASRAGYVEIEPPLVVNEASGLGTGQLPDKEGQMYHCQVDNFYLIPTAEVPVTNMYRDVIINQEDLPKKNCAYSACFRREAGSYGKDVRGLNRLHQFDKVEIVRIERPEDSYAALEEMKDHVQGLLEKLELPWHILRLCGGDMSFTSAITFDFEVWSAAQKRWLEVSSVSNFETYQANRLKCRYRGDDKKTHLCHTLNGSALALPRIVAALLENNQTPEGIRIPKVLQQYTGFDIID